MPGVISLLEEMIYNPNSHRSGTALNLNLSILEEVKPFIGSSLVVPFLTQILQANPELKPPCKLIFRRKMGKAFSFWKSKSYNARLIVVNYRPLIIYVFFSHSRLPLLGRNECIIYVNSSTGFPG